MRLSGKTPGGVVCAAYLRAPDHTILGIHSGLPGEESVVSLEYSEQHNGLVLLINHEMLDKCNVKLISRVGGWDNGHDIVEEIRND